MTKLRLIVLVLVVLMLGAVGMAGAQDQGDGDDGNACETGGLIDGKCTTDWHWICGWYLQQWEDAGGWVGNYSIPDWCDPISLLPPKPEEPEASTDPVTDPGTVPGCYNDDDYWSFYYTGVSGTLVTWYEDNLDCSGTPADYPGEYGVEAPDYDSAMAICEDIVGEFPDGWNPSASGYNSPANLWICYED
jgi:hypothetical protein